MFAYRSFLLTVRRVGNDYLPSAMTFVDINFYQKFCPYTSTVSKDKYQKYLGHYFKMSTFILYKAALSFVFDIESKAMAGIKCIDRIFQLVTTRPTSFVTIRPNNKIQIFLLIKSKWRKRDYENCISYID